MSQHWQCDCQCLTSGLAARHSPAPRPSPKHLRIAVEAELRHILLIAACAHCPSLDHFQQLFRQRTHALPAIVRSHMEHASGSCHASASGSGLRHHECVGAHAWKIMRVVPLVAHLSELSECNGRHQALRDTWRACAHNASAAASAASPPGPPFVHIQMYHGAAAHGKTYHGDSYIGLALDDPKSACDLSLGTLAPSLKRYPSLVLGESAGHCRRLWRAVPSIAGVDLARKLQADQEEVPLAVRKSERLCVRCGAGGGAGSDGADLHAHQHALRAMGCQACVARAPPRRARP